MFNGFFNNIDNTEDVKEEFLKNGEQTLPIDPLRNRMLENYDNTDFNLGQYYVFSKSTDIFETGIGI